MKTATKPTTKPTTKLQLRRLSVYFLTFALLVLTQSCDQDQAASTTAEHTPPHNSASAFLDSFYQDLKPISEELESAQWVYATYINDDSAKLASRASERYHQYITQSVLAANQLRDLEMSEQERRQLELLVLSTSMPSPSDPDKLRELSEISTELEGIYGSGKYCRSADECFNLQALSKTIAKSRDYDELLEAWVAWRTVSEPMRPMYERFVELTKEGAQEFGYRDLGAMWKSGYDMDVTDFEHTVEALWSQVKPLYEQLHCHTKHKLNEYYGDDKVPLDQAIPAHLLGNMWSQTWENIYDLLAPYPDASSPDITRALVDGNYDAIKMTQTAENFFVSLGLPKLPKSFYKHSMLTRPKDREVVCHASAWDMGGGQDPRIKQCIEATEEHLSTIHHELGHIYYFMMYKDQPELFKTGAHDGFHEAIGDTIVLSMTPDHLKKIGLISDASDDQKAKINRQMRMALEKIAFLPFGKLIDQWRWKVFSGEIAADQYNREWWRLRETYQGVRPPVSRSENNFDPGAKYHIPGNTPYTRYFLSFILQFQFHQALCESAGFSGELSDCSIYQNLDAGKRLSKVLSIGASQPWQDTMQQFTGSRNMSADALLEYFAPLQSWLREQNRGKQCAWGVSQ